MSIHVRLYRPPCVLLQDGSPCVACRPAPPVSDPLISTDQVAIARGRAILDRDGYQWRTVNGTIPADTNMEPGALVERIDEDGSYKAKLQAITYTVKLDSAARNFTADAALTLLRLADD